jgi:cellobiose phosphorylase
MTDEAEMDALVRRCRENLKAGRAPLDGLTAAETERLRTRYWTFEDVHDDEGLLKVATNAIQTPDESLNRYFNVRDAIEQLATPFGHMLLAPPYAPASRPLVGRIADQLPGMFENGSIYTHGESFYLYALVCAGRTDRWYEEIARTLPSNLIPDLSTAPPHQQSNFFVGPAHAAYGTNLFSNFTGSLAWYRRGIERVVGLVPEFDGLCIDPRPPRGWGRYRVMRTFRGSRFLVDFAPGDKLGVELDGRPCHALIPAGALTPGAPHRIEVTYPSD